MLDKHYTNVDEKLLERLVIAVERIAQHLAPIETGSIERPERTARKQLSYEELWQRQQARQQRAERLQPELEPLDPPQHLINKIKVD